MPVFGPAQNILLVSQSINLGFVVDYFSTDDPTGEETRNAYFHATG